MSRPVQTQSELKGTPPSLLGLARGNILQRACACGQHTASNGGECEECKKKRQGMLQHAGLNPSPIPSRAGRLRTKLAINTPGDEYEREADRIADQVIAVAGHFSVSNILPRIQRFTGQSMGGTAVAPALVDQALASPGRTLEPMLRQDMEQRFGYDFSQVRVHSNATAEQSAREVNAHAYTVGQDIVFGAGRFAPGTSEGRWLIAHELTHVVQQSNGTPALQCFVDCKSFRRPSRQMSLEDCPAREPGEDSRSRHEPSIVIYITSPEVGYLITNFDIGKSKLKASARIDPEWPTMIETITEPDSQWELLGLSDCQGTERINTSLRQQRADSVRAALPPAAAAHIVGSRGANLNDCITDNQDLVSRQWNRSVLITRTKGKLDIPQDVITARPKRCGPESTQWLVDQMNKNRNHPAIRTFRQTKWPRYIPFFNLGWTYGFLEDFRDLVRAGGPWDFKSNQQQWRAQAGRDCPSHDCDKTVTLCGRCFNYDVPGNIHYGWIGRQAGLRPWFLHNRASAAQSGGVDDAMDTVAIDIGIAMADDGKTLCDELRQHGDKLNLEKTDGCNVCTVSS